MIGFFIIFISIIFAGIFYWYAFVFNVAIVTLQSNQSDFSVSLEANQQIIQKSCEEKNCNIWKIPPFDFKIIAEKKWFETIEKNIKFSRNISTIDLEFKQDFTPIKLEEILDETDEKILDSLENNSSLIEQKREELKKQKDLYFSIKTENNRYYFYDKNTQDNILTLWKNDVNLWNVPVILKDNIQIIEIIWSENEFIFQTDAGYKLFEIWKNNFQDFDFKIDISYIKKSNAQEYILITQKWPFIWNKAKNIFDYNHLFDDFILFNQSYIWIISSNNTILKNKIFPNESISGNIFYQYFPQTKQKQILFENNMTLEKIFYENEKIILQDNSQQKYYIPHLKK